ncbi:Fe-S cluster assembly sulfur transfer protein SufU [Eremococcus coleocola]|uniref:SUF system FeS assembly protein, NifU family n=1 Tax=Eremococcus coleocola ACS-139-V-Col8 TaxID=908337 RepID=E4KQU0_9LACT|nr:SUF system NifU family Fe-S cluster assembly protein [Eremococcus coleocola]EFR30743.1 SUF system FeS assembly protein, NifU family [Eremococcus coleocola ACS-139-V-Col8]
MGLEQLNDLYQMTILDHAQHPRHFGSLAQANYRMELYNPTCGDQLEVQMLVQDGIIQDISFMGTGCSISLASASMMTQTLKGHDLDQAQELIQNFDFLIGGLDDQGQTHSLSLQDQAQLKDATILAGVRKFPARYKCAALAWKASQACLDQHLQDQTQKGSDSSHGHDSTN